MISRTELHHESYTNVVLFGPMYDGGNQQEVIRCTQHGHLIFTILCSPRHCILH